MKKKLSYLILSLHLVSVSAFADDWSHSPRGLDMIRAADTSVIAKTEILTAYGLNHWLYQMPLQVVINKNTAVITGQVQNSVQKHLAVEIAKAAQGIKQVEDKIQLDPDTPPQLGQIKFIQKVRDLNVTGKIMAKLATNNPFYGKINVICYQGHITLTGFVQNQQQKQQAEKIAAQTMGVVSVTNLLEIN